MTHIKNSRSGLLLLSLLTITVACQKRIENSKGRQVLKNEKVENTAIQSGSYQTPKDVDAIKELYAAWDQKEKNGSFKKIYFNYNCENEKSGVLTYFFEDGKLRIIEHTYSEYDHFSATDRYYVTEGIAFFIYSKEVVWSFEAEGKTKDNVTEYRGYIINDKPVECLEKKYSLSSHVNNNLDPDQIANKISDCRNIQKLIKNYEKLATYKSSSDVDCL